MRLPRLLRHKRPIDLEQVTGFLMLLGAFALYWRPNTTSLEWIASLWDIPHLTTLVMLAFGVGGFVLCLLENSRACTFGVLTAPVALYGTLAVAYALSNELPIFGAGVFGAFWLILQFAHAQQREVQAWTRR